MFGLSEFGVKVVGIVVIALLVIAGVWGSVKYLQGQQEKITDLTTTTVVQSGVITDQAGTIDKDTKVAGINEATNTGVQAATKQTADKQAAVTTKYEHRTDVIDRQYQPTPEAPITPDSAIAKSTDLASASIDSLWESYCIAAPDATECVAPAPKPGAAPTGEKITGDIDTELEIQYA